LLDRANTPLDLGLRGNYGPSRRGKVRGKLDSRTLETEATYSLQEWSKVKIIEGGVGRELVLKSVPLDSHICHTCLC